MSAAHPWLEGMPDTWPKEKLPREQLEERIERMLGLTNMGYLATLGKSGPIVSPLEFYGDGLDVYVFPQPGSPKEKAMERDPRVSFACSNHMAGWASAMGAQFFGKAELLEVGTPDWEHGMKVFKWPASSFEIGGNMDAPPQGRLMRLRPDRIVYTEHWLRKQGFAPRQIWRREEA
jgi:hypothetical protein